MPVDYVGIEHGMVIRVKSLLEKLIALSSGHKLEVDEAIAERLKTLEVLCHIVFIFHEVLC
jgi:hypothetical protein